MLIWGALLIPILVIGCLMALWRHKVTWWEYLVQLGVPALVIAIVFFASAMGNYDKEYWGGWMTTAEHFEAWDEYIHRTCTRSYSCGTSKNPRTCTQTYDCSFVRYHDEFWRASDSNGSSWRMTQGTYNGFVKLWGADKFVDMKRNFHHRDGDKHITVYPGNDTCFVPTTKQHKYENKVAHSDSIMKFDDVSDEDVEKYKLYDYPEPNAWVQNACLGCNDLGTKKLDYWNGKLGASKQARMYILVFEDQPREAGIMQQHYWKNGNKNEFVVTVGVSGGSVQWVHPFSWTPNHVPLIEARDFVSVMSPFDSVATADFMAEQVSQGWVRREFEEFSYLSSEPHVGFVIGSYVLALLTSLGLAVFVVRNDQTNTSPARRRRYRR